MSRTNHQYSGLLARPLKSKYLTKHVDTALVKLTPPALLNRVTTRSVAYFNTALQLGYRSGTPLPLQGTALQITPKHR